MFDLLIRNGTLIDGSKRARYRADLGIRGDRIDAIGDLGQAEARQTVDAAGKIVAPGFVDVHTHSDAWLLKKPHLVTKTGQGFTTELIMDDGISYAPVDPTTVHDWIFYQHALNGLRFEEYQGWQSIADYLSLLDGKTAQNVATHIPYANLRVLAAGFTRPTPDDYQMSRIVQEVELGLAAGAVGLSTGLDYVAQAFSSTAELAEACRPMAASGALYVTHVRYQKGTLAGVQEAVEIGKQAGVPVHISHLKAKSQAEIDALLTYIDRVAINEVDFSFDVYPYVPGSTMVHYLLPHEIWLDGPLGALPKLKEPQIRRRFEQRLRFMDPGDIRLAWLPSRENSHHQGKTVAAYAAETGRSPVDALCDLLIEENMAVLMVFGWGEEAQVDPFLAHPNYMMGTDGIYHPDGVIHPRQYGAAPRLLGAKVRQAKLFSLEEAVYKLSGYPAARFGLTRRGLLQEGYFADVTVFDPETVADRATYDQPDRAPVGIEQVLVNGVPVVRDGRPVEALPTPLPGRVLKFKEAL